LSEKPLVVISKSHAVDRHQKKPAMPYLQLRQQLDNLLPDQLEAYHGLHCDLKRHADMSLRSQIFDATFMFGKLQKYKKYISDYIKAEVKSFAM
jgi:hypothetical protein